MKKDISIAAALLEKWPATRLGCLQYKVTVQKRNEEMWQFFKKQILRPVKDDIFASEIKELPNVKASRAAYQAFGQDPSRYRVSSEALLRRIAQGKGLYEVNTVVDVNNMISLRSGFSLGSYDVAQLGERLTVRLGEDDEVYKGIGKAEIKIAKLPVLSDAQGAIGSSTSDSERAMITLTTKEVLTIVYSFSDNQDLEAVLAYGREYFERFAGARDIESWIMEGENK